MNLEKFYLLAIKLSRKTLGPEECYDFAGWLCLQRLEGRALKQSIKHSIIDYKRNVKGDTRYVRGRERMVVAAKMISIGSPGEAQSQSVLNLDTHLTPLLAAEEAINIKSYLEGRDLEVFNLYVNEELSAKEIGKRLGLSGVLIGKILKRIVLKVRRKLASDSRLV